MQYNPHSEPRERDRAPLDSAPSYDPIPHRMRSHDRGYGSSNQAENLYYDEAPGRPMADSNPALVPLRSHNNASQFHPSINEKSVGSLSPYDNLGPHTSSRHRDFIFSSQTDPGRGISDPADYVTGGMPGVTYNTSEHLSRQGSPEVLRSAGQVPPPPSWSQHQNTSRQGYSPHNSGNYPYEYSSVRGQNFVDRDSHSSLNPFGTTVGTHSGSHSPARSLQSFSHSDSYADDPYQGCSSNTRPGDAYLGVVNPNDIEDDGDDGLNYSKSNQRNSMLNAFSLERGSRSAAGAAPAGRADTADSFVGNSGNNALRNGGRGYEPGPDEEKPSEWLKKQKGTSKKGKWAVIIIIFLVIVGAIVGGVVGGLVAGSKNGGKSSGSEASAEDDRKKNGDLDINSSEIVALLNNPDLHKVFPGVDYTPFNTQYPDCIHNPPSQNNVTRDVAVLSQLTNKIRLYGTDCNQTQMVIHATRQLKLTNDIKIWLGVWQDNNQTTNARQLDQMWNILDEFGASPFEGIIVANEVLFRKDMTIATLGKILDGVRTNLTRKNIKLPVATSDLGDDWTSALAADSDYIMANIHPFFAGVSASQAAAWTWNFWQQKDGPLFKSDSKMNIISETGWPTKGGKNCGSATATTCDPGSVAGIDELNQFMEDWVCAALNNGTNYFWFEAFDEPWKIRFNEKGKEWEDQWGLMDVNRNLKKGVKIPDCGGKTIS